MNTQVISSWPPVSSSLFAKRAPYSQTPMQATTSKKQALVNKAFALLESLDFKMLKLKLQDTEDGLGWTAEECDRIELDYKRYMALKFAYPDEEIVPTKAVNKFWQHHILDTQAYTIDCEHVFGYYVHHYPYFCMMNEQDLRDLHLALADTSALYRKHFGVDSLRTQF